MGGLRDEAFAKKYGVWVSGPFDFLSERELSLLDEFASWLNAQ
jgi:hypothetical protein